MTKIANIQFDHASNTGLPALNGVGSLNAIRTGVAEGATSYPAVGAGGRIAGFADLTMSANSSRKVPTLQLLEGNFVAPTNPTFDVWLGTDPTAIPSVKSQGAIRAIIAAPSPSGANAAFIGGYSTSTSRWQLAAFNGGGWGFAGADFKAGNPAGGTFRVEVQWDTSQTQWIAARLYANDGTTLFNSLVSSISTGPQGINMLRFGDIHGLAGGVSWYVGEIEVWDTRDGDGTFSNQWNSSAGGVFSTANAGARRSSSYSIPAQFSTPSDSVSADYTTHSAQGYGNVGRAMDVYIPNGTPPNGVAWPVVLWAHSGFFVSGSRNDLIAHWRNRLLNAGYAVASVDYVKATITNTTYQAYGTTDTPSGANTAYGRYPSFIVDYKLAAVRLRDKYAAGGTSPLTNSTGYGIDGTKMFASGYSAGGYLALGAALSRDLTNDGSSRDLTIAGNSTYRTMETGSAYTGADPVFVGAYVYAAPTSIKLAMDNDWSHNLTNAVLWPPFYTSGVPTTQAGAGPVHITARAFMGTAATGSDPSGTTFTDTDVANLIAKQHAANPSHLNIPVHYVAGEADYLVHSAHQAALAAAVAGTAIDYSASTSPANHDKLDEVYDFAHLEAFLDAAVATPWVPQVYVL